MDYIQELIENHLAEVDRSKAVTNLGTFTRSLNYTSELTTCSITIDPGLENFKGTAIVTLSGSSNTQTASSSPEDLKVTSTRTFKNNTFLNTLTSSIYTASKIVEKDYVPVGDIYNLNLTVGAFPSKTFQLKIVDSFNSTYSNVTFSNLRYIKATGSGALSCYFCYEIHTNDNDTTGYEFRTAYLALPSNIDKTISTLSLSGDRVTISPGSSVSNTFRGQHRFNGSNDAAISFTFSVDFVRSVT